MKKKKVITLLLVLPILVNCQTQEHAQEYNLGVDPMSFDAKTQPDIRGIISYDKYQVVVANGYETVSDIAKRLELDPRKFSLFNGLVESYRPRQGELLALNKKIDAIKNTNKTVWSQKNTKNVLARAKETKQVSMPTKDFAKHTVETGETIYSIARLYNVSVTSLAKLNKLDAEFTIYLGQNIIIPIMKSKINLPKEKIKTVTKKLVDNQKNKPVPLSEKQNEINTKITFIIPVEGKIISKYNPNNEKQKNQGIDFQVSPGSPVFAAASGTVALITDNTENFGKIVLIRHKNNLISIYGRVAKVLVEKNEVVNEGQKIGSMAEKGNDGKNQTILHFELRRGTQSVNPENYFE
jgi:LysM repeat protein